MSEFVNLNEAGALTQAGHGYRQDADAGVTESRSFQRRMDQSQPGLRGRAGREFTALTTQHAGNLARLGRQFAEQAHRAVKGEQAILSADDEAFTAQQAAASMVDSQSSALTRPINAA
jgi:hypothetical protein